MLLSFLTSMVKLLHSRLWPRRHAWTLIAAFALIVFLIFMSSYSRILLWNNSDDDEAGARTSTDKVSKKPRALSKYSDSNVTGLKICLYSNQAGERGTEIALYDYAHYLEVTLKMRSHIIFPRYLEKNSSAPFVGGRRLGLPRFLARFPVSFCGQSFEKTQSRLESTHPAGSILHRLETRKSTDFAAPAVPCHDLSQVAKQQDCKVLYVIKKGGMNDPPQYPSSFTAHIPSAIHAVFTWEKHGTTYAAVSGSVTRGDKNLPVVPHMIIPPAPDLVASVQDFKKDFNIPAPAKVFCRHGGKDKFNIPYVQTAVINLVRLFGKHQLHFLFLGTDSFKDADAYPSQIHFIPSTSSDVVKERYFKTCDAMLHARADGETFGLAVAEFSVRNKPVLTQGATMEKRRTRLMGGSDVSKGYVDAHVKILGGKGFYYHDEKSLIALVTAMLVVNERGGGGKNMPSTFNTSSSLNAYSDYEPAKVMATFKRVFLDPIFGHVIPAADNSTTAMSS